MRISHKPPPSRSISRPNLWIAHDHYYYCSPSLIIQSLNRRCKGLAKDFSSGRENGSGLGSVKELLESGLFRKDSRTGIVIVIEKEEGRVTIPCWEEPTLHKGQKENSKEKESKVKKEPSPDAQFVEEDVDDTDELIDDESVDLLWVDRFTRATVAGVTQLGGGRVDFAKWVLSLQCLWFAVSNGAETNFFSQQDKANGA